MKTATPNLFVRVNRLPTRQDARDLARTVFATCESLEGRILLTGATPTAYEQYVLQLVNRARANPGAEVTRLANQPWGDNPSLVAGTSFPIPQTPSLNEGLPAGTISNTAKPPLAFNVNLIQAARDYSNTLLTNDQSLTHTYNGTSPTSRDQSAGYSGVAGENLAVQASSGSLPIDAQISETLHDNLFIDGNVTGRGHRTNLLNASSGYREVGLGLGASSNYTGLGNNVPNAVLLTEDFGIPNSGGPILTGVAINDGNSDNFYEPGEGLGGVSIVATRTSDGATFTTATWNSGGYSLPLAAGTYSVTATGGNIGTVTPSTVTIGTDNVEQDFSANDTGPVNNNVAPAVTTQPTSQSVVAGATATFTAAASGTPAPTVQWQVSVNGGTFTAIDGATDTTLNVQAVSGASGNKYRAVFTNVVSSAASSAATLVVTQAGPPLGVTLGGVLPGSAISGTATAAKLTLTLTNNTGALINGPVTISLFLSQSQSLDGSEVAIRAPFNVTVKEATGAKKAISVALKSLPRVGDGHYFVIARATVQGNSAVASSVSSISLAAPFVNLSETVSVVSPVIKRGKKATIAIKVTNSGNVVAKGPLVINLSGSTDGLGAGLQTLPTLRKTINIKAHTSQTVRLSVPIAPALTPGKYFVSTTINPNDTIPEANLNDNSATSSNSLTIL